MDVIHKKLDNGECRGEYRENLQKVSLHQLRKSLQSEDAKKYLDSLYSVNIEKKENAIHIRYADHAKSALDDTVKEFQWDLAKRNGNFMPCSNFASQKSEVVLNGGLLTEKSTADIFHSLNETHKHAEGQNRNFIAILAVKLKDVFCESHTKHEVEILQQGIFSHYPEMFNNGEGVMYILQKQNKAEQNLRE